MEGIPIPKSGLVLGPAGADQSVKDGTSFAQVMQLDLKDGMFEEILKASRHGGKALLISFGKTISLHYGTKQRPLSATRSTSHAQLYNRSTEDTTDLDFVGRLTHKLAMQQAQEDIAGADEALAKLQNSLASAKQAKQSNQIKYVPDGSSLPPPVKQTVASLKHRGSKSSLSFLKKGFNSSRSNHSTTHSMPASPSLDAALAPLGQQSIPTSAPPLPIGKVQRLQAIRSPLLHLLAIRPLSTKYLAQNLRCSEDDVLTVLQRVGKPFRLDETKWDLSDKFYKELDVWHFNYPDQHDRDLAIDRSVSAFDRMRLSQEDQIWQKLYPKSERGKGKTLSNLNHLHKGPIQQSATPKIHVEHPEESASTSQQTRNESDQKGRLTPNAADPMVRSFSHDPVKRKKISEKEAQSKRLLSKGPKKAAPTKKEKEDHPAVKRGGKKEAKKGPAPKSAEFVNDSDEEEDGFEAELAREAQESKPKVYGIPPVASKPAPPTSATSTPKVKPTTSSASKATKPLAKPQTGASAPIKGVSSKVQKQSTPTPSTPKPSTPHSSSTPSHSKPRPKHGVSSAEKQKAAERAERAEKQKEADRAERAEGQKEAEKQREAEPRKEARIKAAKEARKKQEVPPTKAPERKSVHSTPNTNGTQHRTSDSSQGGVGMEKSLSRQRNTSSPHKPSPLGSSPPTNASDLDYPLHSSSSSSTPMIAQTSRYHGTAHGVNGSARRPNGHSRNISDQSLKRRAGDLDSDGLSHSIPLTNGYADSHTNGHAQSHKRRKTSEPTPPSSQSGSPPSFHELAMEKALDFKEYHLKYQSVYHSVSSQDNPSPEDVEKVTKMDRRLKEMKKEITSLWAESSH